MTLVIDRLPARDSVTAIARRPSLYRLLTSSLLRPRKPAPLPGWLHADLGLQPARNRECIRRGQ